MVGYIEATKEELKKHKKQYGARWEEHAISLPSSDPAEASKGSRGYFCPCCGLMYDFSNAPDAQSIFDKKQAEHFFKCSRNLWTGDEDLWKCPGCGNSLVQIYQKVNDETGGYSHIIKCNKCGRTKNI